MVPSQLEHSPISPSPVMTNGRAVRPSPRLASEIPTPRDKPSTSEPGARGKAGTGGAGRRLDAPDVVHVRVHAEGVARLVVAVEDLFEGVEPQVRQDVVEQNAVVALAQDEAVTIRIVQVLRVESEEVVVQRDGDVGSA